MCIYFFFIIKLISCPVNDLIGTWHHHNPTLLSKQIRVFSKVNGCYLFIDKADFSENDSKTQHTHNGTPLEEHSPSKDLSQDTDECLISNCNKNQETTVGSCASISAFGDTVPAVNDEVVPLTGSPYFTVIVRKSHVQFPFQLESHVLEPSGLTASTRVEQPWGLYKRPRVEEIFISSFSKGRP